MEKIIVFDFDKTLTNYDTTLPFFLFCCKKNPFRTFFLPLYLLSKLLSKIKLISVKKEKEIGVIFFCPSHINEFKKRCLEFAKTIRFNSIYLTDLINTINSNEKVIIASASFQYYLEALFPNLIVIGTTLETNNVGKIIGIKQHPFKQEKANLVKAKSMSIHTFYTDSKNDQPTSNLAQKTIWIRNGHKVSIK